MTAEQVFEIKKILQLEEGGMAPGYDAISDFVSVLISQNENGQGKAMFLYEGIEKEAPNRFVLSERDLDLGTSSRFDLASDFVLQILNHASSIVNERTKVLTERNIETLVDLYLEGEQLPAVDRLIQDENARARSDYLKRIGCFSSSEVYALSGGDAVNKASVANRWKQQRKIFALPFRGKDLFPAFQFFDGKPRSIIKKVLETLPDEMSQWQIAFWFDSGNVWLDGKAPQNRLRSEKLLLKAAQMESKQFIG